MPASCETESHFKQDEGEDILIGLSRDRDGVELPAATALLTMVTGRTNVV